MTLYTLPKETEINCSQFGAVGDGVTDDTVAIQSALDRAHELLEEKQQQGLSGKAIVKIAGGTYLISSQITVPNGITLRGETLAPPYPNRQSGFKSNNNMFTGTEIVCSADFVGENAILLDNDNCNIENLILDGHNIPCGWSWTKIDVLTAQGRRISASYLNFPVNDPDDNRIFNLKVETWEIPFFQIGQYMEYQLHAVGGTDANNYSWSIIGGALPNGLTLSADGLISGTATTLERVFPEFQVSDGTNTHSQVFASGTTFDEIDTRVLLPATAGATYSFFLESLNNKPNLVWEGVNLPSWLSLNSSTGELTAPATTTRDDVGFYHFKVRLYDESQNLLEVKVYNFELRYADGAINVFGEANLKPQQNVPFSYIYQGSGGYGDYTWSINEPRSAEAGNATIVTATSPYTGLSLNTATGEISGTATTLGRNVYYLRATSNVDPTIFYEVRRTIKVEEAGGTPKFITRSLKTAQKGQPYNYQVNVTDVADAQPYTYEAVGLPTGLTLDPNTGLISGTPTGSTFVNGVRIQWSDSVKNCTIRGFRSGGGIYSKGASNIHRMGDTLISVCDVGIKFADQTWDSHFRNLFIYNCRVGMDLGAGSAGMSFAMIRIEFIHENGIHMKTAHENNFVGMYFDTCGQSAMRVENSDNMVVIGCRYLRSGRNIRGTETRRFPNCNKDLSNHVYISDSHSCTFTGNNFDIGTKSSGTGLFLTDHFSDNIRPTVGFRIHNCHELTITGNNLGGCVNNSIDADLSTFGENSFEGNNISNNVQTDKYLVAFERHHYEEKLYIPNQCFQVWQRDMAFNIPPSTDSTSQTFPIADYWTIKRGGMGAIDQNIIINRGTDAPISDGYYIHIEKPLNTVTAPGNNYQLFELFNKYSTKLKYTSNKNIILSFYAKSPNANNIKAKVSQYAASADNNFDSIQRSTNDIKLDSNWKRYQFYFELGDLEGITFGENAIFNIIFELGNWDEDYNVDLTGVQVDFCQQTPFADELRVNSFENELAIAQLKYQTSKDYDQYFGSWAGGYRYDVNGANWGNSYQSTATTSTEGLNLQTTIYFDTPLPEHPGHPNQTGNILAKVKLVNTKYINDRTNIRKYSFNGTNDPLAYVERASRRSVVFSARGESVAQSEDYAYHWIYTDYEEDTTLGGGYESS